MSAHRSEPDEPKGLTEEEQAAIDEEMAEFRKLKPVRPIRIATDF